MKNLLLAFAFAFLATPAYSQFHLGLSGGANMTFWTWDLKFLSHSIDYEPAMGWRTAVLGEWQMNPTVGFRAEFGTQVKVNKISRILQFPDWTMIPATIREYYQYWEGSLLVQLSPIKKFNDFYLIAGGTAGRLERARNKLSGTGDREDFSSQSSIDITGPYWNRNAFAADFGMGGNIPLGVHSKLKIEARYQQNLSNLSKSGNVDARVNTLMLNVGYLHRL